MGRNLRLGAMASLLLGSLTVQPASADMPAMLLEWAGKAMAEYNRIQAAAAQTMATDRSADSCAVRVARLARHLKEATRLATLSAAIYSRTEALQMQHDQVTTMVLHDQAGHTVLAFRDPNSDAYAEMSTLNDDVVIVFRGTRITSLKDIASNIAQFAGVMPTNYLWASALVADLVKQFPGRRLIVTGHSLGGGMAMYSALHNPVEAVVFNPAGLSPAALAGTSIADAGTRTTAFIAHSGRAVDPVSALSLAGESTIVGRRYVIEVGPAPNPIGRHEASRLAQALAGLSQDQPEMPVDEMCDADLGLSAP